jgi:hypothetical protein
VLALGFLMFAARVGFALYAGVCSSTLHYYSRCPSGKIHIQEPQCPVSPPRLPRRPPPTSPRTCWPSPDAIGELDWSSLIVIPEAQTQPARWNPIPHRTAIISISSHLNPSTFPNTPLTQGTRKVNYRSVSQSWSLPSVLFPT